MDTKEGVKTSKDEAKKNLNILQSIKNLFKNELEKVDETEIVNGTTELVAGGTLYFEGEEIAVNTYKPSQRSCGTAFTTYRSQ